jgi:hypothetical protein
VSDIGMIERHADHADDVDEPAAGCRICEIEARATRDPKTCPHEDFAAVVDVGRITEQGGTDPYFFAATVMVFCADCAAAFGWRGFQNRVGVDPRVPLVSPDALELRAPLIPPSEIELLGPLAAMQPSAGPDGPGVRFRVRDETDL